MSSGELKRAKRDVRRRVLAARDALPIADREAAASAVAVRLLALPEVRAAGTVMAFSSFGSELPMDPVLEALSDAGVTVGLPKIVEGGDLEVRAFRPGDATTATSFGGREPADGARIEPLDLDVVVTPAVAFDRHGRRIGYGGGFYDRFFPRARADAVRIGVAVPLQVLDQELPAGAFDLRVHLIVTPDETIRCEP